eukprot:965625-Amphidinium_carterae.1
MIAHLELLMDKSGSETTLPFALPLFPDAAGKPVEREKLVDVIEEVARSLNLPLARADGLPRFTGHSLRVTGAQLLSKLGLE